jgi:cytochrome c peroxidase
MTRHRWSALALALIAGACGGSPGDELGANLDNPALDDPVVDREPEVVDVPTPWPIKAFPEIPASVTEAPEARVELGRLLFFDPVLSVDEQTACATCHSERWGMSDGLKRSVGHGAGLLSGPRRRGPNTLRRNSMTLYNLVFRETLLWDGRATTLEEQALLPLLSEEEMNVDPAEAIEKLRAIPEYVERFEEAFPEDPNVSVANMTSALAAYQRTFISNGSTYDAYVSGRPELMTDQQVEGMFRFAELGCDSCHVPPLFESETFADRNVPEVDGVVDYGLEEHTGHLEDRGKFRTVTLRNLLSTGPYFHNGSIVSMGDAVRHELEQSGLPYDDEDVRLILGFIDKTLRDERLEAIRPFELPSGLPVPLDPPGSR